MAIDYEAIEYHRWGIEPETQACANCTHFHQHYCKNGSLIFGGHCTYPRMKPRNPNDTCEHFQNKNAPSDAANT